LGIFLACSFIGLTQKDYAKSMLDSLCSPRYDGRGYVNNGDIRAADFLAREFQKIGVQPFDERGYFQEYDLPINTFPYSIHLQLDEDTLVPGVDFLVDPHSGSAQGEFEIIEVNSDNFFSDFGGQLNLENQKSGQFIYALNFTDISDREKKSKLKQLAYAGMRYFPMIWVEKSKQFHSVRAPALNYPMFTIDSASYVSAKKANIKVNNKYIPKYRSKNVIGLIPGKKKKKYIVFSAHYDHLGRMGTETYFPGANDNASGVAMLLSLAKHYVQNPPKYSIVFCLFSGEEAGLHGSRYFVSNPFFKLKKVKFVLNIDIMGGASDGITVVNATEHQKAYEELVQINEENNLLAKVKRRGPTQNSDHYYFTQSGVPAFFIYSLGAVKNYHDIYDTAENTPLNKFDEVQKLLIEFVKRR
jgi:hypothetical protein